VALISCPECKKEISDKALSCPSCGYPLKTNTGNEADLVEATTKTPNQESNNFNWDKVILCPYCGKGVPEQSTCMNCGKPMSIGLKINCPTCKSNDVDKISGANKVGSALMFGVFSLGHISKTFKCNKCGYKW